MEPKLIRKDINYQKKILVIVSVLVISLFIGGSFSLLSSSDETEEVVSFKTGNFNLEVATTGTLSLEGELPKSYDDGFKNNDITLTLTNTGSLEIGKYEVKLEGDTETTLDANYIRYSVSEDDGKTYLASKLLSDTNNIIYTGYSLKDNKILKVKLWIDEKAGEAALKKSYNGKINVELYQNEDTAIQVVKSKLVSNYSGNKETFEGGLVAVNNDGNLYHEANSETIREYRYSGPSVNNYVTFNDELWRIIGIFKDENGEEHVKIVRNNILDGGYLAEEFNVDDVVYSIHNSSLVYPEAAQWYGRESSLSDWSTSGLSYFLNNKQDTNGKNKGYLSYLSIDSLNQIADSKYYLGDVLISSNPAAEGNNTTTISSYEMEHNINNGLTEDKSTWIGKIGLMYPSDYGYSAHNNYWNNTGLGIYSSIFSKSWMSTMQNVKERHMWFISPSKYSGCASILLASGNVTFTNIIGTSSGGRDVTVRPTLYLKGNVKIISGTGEVSNPFKLILE